MRKGQGRQGYVLELGKAKKFETDSPTRSRESVWVTIRLIASKEWKLNSIDVKTALLQRKVK